MTTVSMVTLGTVRAGLGWTESARKIDTEGTTVRDVLGAVPFSDGSSLLDFLTEDGEMRPEYMIRLNGGCVRRKAGLDTQLKDGDTVLAMDIVRFIAGG